MARYSGNKAGNVRGDVTITDDDGDNLVVRESDKKGHVVLAIVAKGEIGGPCVEIKADWLMRAVLEVNGAA